MYKTLLLLKTSDKDEVNEYFSHALFDHIKEMSGLSCRIGRVDNSILFPESYQKVIEMEATSKIEMESALMSLEGRKFTKALQNFHTYVTVISFEFE